MMLREPLSLLLNAFGLPGTNFVLGAGASVPNVPTLGQIPAALSPFADHLGSFPATLIPDSPLRRLIAPLIERARYPSLLEEWKAGAMTSATVAVLLEELIARAHWQRLPQYEVFRLFPLASNVVSFNWDGLAGARCPQIQVIQPHGALRPRPLLPQALEDLLDDSQFDDSLDVRRWVLPDLVMPGEEESPILRPIRERVLELWLTAPAVIVIGYSFGMGQTIAYDRVWLDMFAETMSRNAGAAVHVVAPNASDIRGELAERLKREVNVFAWPMSWYLLSRAIIRVAGNHGLIAASALGPHGESIASTYHVLTASGADAA